eukprot:1268748-Pleurochrysis_carterae.AAC.1
MHTARPFVESTGGAEPAAPSFRAGVALVPAGGLEARPNMMKGWGWGGCVGKAIGCLGKRNDLHQYCVRLVRRERVPNGACSVCPCTD